MLACEALGALALVGTRQVEAGATILTLSRNVTLIDISLTLLPCEAGETFAGKLVGHSGTGTSICTWLRQAGINPLAQLPYRKDNRTQKWKIASPSTPPSSTHGVAPGALKWRVLCFLILQKDKAKPLQDCVTQGTFQKKILQGP